MTANPSPARRFLPHVLCFLLGAALAVPVGLLAVRAEQEKTKQALAHCEATREQAEVTLARAVKAETEGKRRLQRAEANFKLARKAVDEVFAIASDHPALQAENMKDVRKQLLEKAGKARGKKPGHE